MSGVQITTILSDASKDKNVDTAKIFVRVGEPPERIEVSAHIVISFVSNSLGIMQLMVTEGVASGGCLRRFLPSSLSLRQDQPSCLLGVRCPHL